MRSQDEIELIMDELRGFFDQIVVARKPASSWTLTILKRNQKPKGVKGSLGFCEEWSNGDGRVVMDYNHVSTADYNDLIDTFLHECAHALAGVTNGHNGVWKHWARFLGATPKAKAKTKLQESTDSIQKAKWLIVLKDKGFIKPITSCGRRPKNLKDRYYKDIPGSKGKLYIIDWNVYHNLESDKERALALAQ